MKPALNCWPWVRSLTHSPAAVTLCLLFIHPRDGDHGYTQPERAPGGRAVSGRTLQPRPVPKLEPFEIDHKSAA